MESGDEIKNNMQLPFYNLFLNAGYVSGNNSPWRYFASILVTIFAYFTYQIFLGLIFIAFAQTKGLNIYSEETIKQILKDPTSLGISKNIMLTLLLGMFIFTFIVFYVAIKYIHNKTFISLITAYPQIRWKRVFYAFAVWSVLYLIMFVVDYLFISKNNYVFNFNFNSFIVLCLISVCFLPIQTSFEEIFFRGYLMQGLSLVFKNGLIPLIITSLLFGIAHLSNPEVEEFGLAVMFPFYTLFGLFLGILALWNYGLELSIGIHAANNILSALLVTSKSSVLQTDAIFIVLQQNPFNDFILWLCGASIALLIFQYTYQFKNHIQSFK